MKVGDLVMMAEFNAPPKLYGVGVIVERIELCDVNANAIALKVAWSGGSWNGVLSPVRIGSCHPRVLKRIS